MSEESIKKEQIERWLNADGWNPHKQQTGQDGTSYNLKDNKFQLVLDGNIDKITSSYSYILSPELQSLGESQMLDFLYELRVDLLPLDVYLKVDSNTKTIELQNFIFWEDNIRNKLLHSMYKMEQSIGLCEIKDKIFVKRHQMNSVISS